MLILRNDRCTGSVAQAMARIMIQIHAALACIFCIKIWISGKLTSNFHSHVCKILCVTSLCRLKFWGFAFLCLLSVVLTTCLSFLCCLRCWLCVVIDIQSCHSIAFICHSSSWQEWCDICVVNSLCCYDNYVTATKMLRIPIIREHDYASYYYHSHVGIFTRRGGWRVCKLSILLYHW